MTPELFIYLMLAGLAGGFINGLAGFGTALFSLGFLLQILPPVQAVGLVLILSVFSGLQGLWIVRQQIFEHPKRLVRFLLPALIGIPLGVYSLSFIDTDMLKIFIGLFMLFYGGLFVLRANLPTLSGPAPTTDSLVGLMGGILGGAAGLSGALVTIWLSMRPYSKNETRAVLQPYNMVVLGLSVLMLAANGAYNFQSIIYLAVLIILMFASGLLLILRSLTGL
jgi:uncharacterized membrane protein YfcA